MARYPDLHAVTTQPAHDPYLLDDPSYDVNRFVVAAGQDSSFIKLRVSNNYLARLAEIVASRTIPEYRTAHDIVRDALHHRLHWLTNEHHFKGLKGDLIQMEILAQNELIKSSLALRTEAIESTREAFDKAAAARDTQSCADILDRARMLYESEEDANTPHGRELKSMIGRFADEIAGME